MESPHQHIANLRRELFLALLAAGTDEGKSLGMQRKLSDPVYQSYELGYFTPIYDDLGLYRSVDVQVASQPQSLRTSPHGAVILGADVDACDWRVIRDGCRELPRGFPSAIEARPRVSLVINACGTRHAPNYFEHHPEITYLAKSRDDDAGGVDASIGADLDEMTQAIEDAVRSNRNVFVHCLEGRSRSAMVVIDWLRRFHGVSVDDALGMVQRARYSTASGTSPPKPNPAFLRVLRERESGVSDASGAGGAGGAGEPEASTADAAPPVPTIADVYGDKSIRVHLRALEQASAKSAIPAVRDVSDMFSEMGVLMFGARNEAELKTQVALIHHVFPTEIMLEVRVPSDGAPLDKKAIWNALRALYIAAGIDG